MSGFIIRPANPDDVSAITAIYRDHVLNDVASFEEDAPDQAEMARRMTAIVASNCPYFVACDTTGHIMGYAYASRFHARAAFRSVVENSIYLKPDAQGKGLGFQLLTALIEACEARGFRQMIAVITHVDPPISEYLHEKAGFEKVGTLQNVGFKFDRWLGVVYMQRRLGLGADAPL